MCENPGWKTSSPGLCIVTLETQPPCRWMVAPPPNIYIRLQPWSVSSSLVSGVFRAWPGLSLYQDLGSENQFDLNFFFFLSFIFQWSAFWTTRLFLCLQPGHWLFGPWGAPLALPLCSWCPWLSWFPSTLCHCRACTVLSEDLDSLAESVSSAVLP